MGPGELAAANSISSPAEEKEEMYDPAFGELIGVQVRPESAEV
jgi:hypothetical protein